MCEQENLKKVQKLYSSVSCGEISAVLDMLVEDVEWEFYGPSIIPFCGRRKGREQVAQFFRRYEELMDVELFEIQEIIVQKEKVIVFGHEQMRVKNSALIYKTPWVHTYIFEQGKISKFCEYADTAAIESALSSISLARHSSI